MANKLAEIISGYSITHVAGRFRATDVVTRKEAATKLVEKTPYLIDETTAVVRFIMPCPSSKREHGERFAHRTHTKSERVSEDIDLIRTLFFLYFAEAIAETIKGEQLIWLVERSPEGERIYAWEKSSDARRPRSRSPKAPATRAKPASEGDVASRAPATSVSAKKNRETPKRSAAPVKRSATTKPARPTSAPAAELKGTIRYWLRTNGYDDVADLIDEVMAEWQKAGKTTRRNWWDVLAGDKQGRPCNVAGRQFPILRSAQRRQQRAITKDAIQRSPSEPLPP